MFGFHKPKMYRSVDGCCICRAKSSSSRFTDSTRYEKDLKSCFGLAEVRRGEICNACVLLVKRWKKLPPGSKKNWNHVVDAKGSSSLKTKIKKKKKKSRVQKGLTRSNSDAHSTTSSASPAQSLTYSYQSDEGSDSELPPDMDHSPAFSFLDLTYWKRQKVCCGIIYKGRYGEVIIDPHLYKPCCQRKQQQQGEEEEMGEHQQANGGNPTSHPMLSGSQSPKVIPEDIQQQQEEKAGNMEAKEEKPGGEEWC